MSKRESFLLRIDPTVLDELKRWAESELRSTNSHIEYLLRQCLISAGRKQQFGLVQPESNGETPNGDAAGKENN